MAGCPRTLTEFEAMFSTEEACRAYLSKLRWPDGFVCPRCQSRASWSTHRDLFACAACGRQVSVIAGTVFQGTRKPLTLWFRAIWWGTTQKTGASALGLQKIPGRSSYQTAWAWLHKLRRAMVRPGRDRLSGRVEVDETYVGSEEEGVSGRLTHKKAQVVIAAEEDGTRTGRIRMRRIESVSRKELHDFVQASVESGSTVHADGRSAYQGLD